MAPKDPGVDAAPLSAVPPGTPAPDISIPTMPHGASLVTSTSVDNATDTIDFRWMTGTSNVRLLSFTPMLLSKPGIQNVGSRNGMPRKSAPQTYRVDARSKDQGWALLERGYAPPLSFKDDPAATNTTCPVIGEVKGTYRALGK
jgi:hypothetical protein